MEFLKKEWISVNLYFGQTLEKMVAAEPEDGKRGPRVIGMEVGAGGSTEGSLASSPAISQGVSHKCSLELASLTANYFSRALKQHANQLKGCTTLTKPTYKVAQMAKPIVKTINRQQSQILRFTHYSLTTHSLLTHYLHTTCSLSSQVNVSSC